MILGLLASLSMLGSGGRVAVLTPADFSGIKPISVIHGDVEGQRLAAEGRLLAEQKKAALKRHRSKERDEEAKHSKGGGDLDKTHPTADSPLDQMLWLRQTLLDSSGTIPSYGLKKAYAERSANIAFHNLQKGVRKPGPAFSLPTNAPWTSRGPSDVGGRTRCLIVMPDSTTLIAGSVGGGVWRSTDSGATWSAANDHMGNIAIDTLAQDPANSNHIYAGTGEAFFNSDADTGAGVFESHDAGVTWNLLSATSSFGNVAKIAISPTNSNIVLAATVRGLGGIQRSTDGGQTWTTVYSAYGSMDVAFDPYHPTHVLAHIIDSSFNNTGFLSTDSGATWSAVSGMGPFNGFVNGRMSFTFSKLTSNLVYCACGDNGGQIWKSVDGGATWTAASGTNVFLQSWYNCFVFIDPNNDNNLFISDNPSSDLLQKSTDGGSTWTTVSDGYNNFADPHADEHFGVSDPNTPNRVYFTTDGGIYKTDNITTAAPDNGWSNLNKGYISTQYYSVDGDYPTGVFAGGLQDNYTILTTTSPVTNPKLAGNVSYQLWGGDGGFTAIDHNNPFYIYGEYVYLNIFSSHGTADPSKLDPTPGVADGYSPGYITSGLSDANNSGRANFISPFILDPNNQQTLLAGGTKLWRTTNARASTPTWTSIRADGSSKISTITVAQGNSDIIWVGQNDGGISTTTNGTSATPTWTSITGPQSGRYIQHITVDPSNYNRIFIAYGGLASQPLWVSNNGGSTWSNASGSGATGLPACPVRYMSIHPNNSSWLFAGTMVGLYSSIDGGATWSTNDFGPANVDTWDCKFMPGTSILLLGTHGRGVWTQNQVAMNTLLSSSGTVNQGGTLTGTVNIYGTADTSGVTVALTGSTGVSVPATVTVPSGSSSATFTITVASNAPTSGSVTGTLYGTTASASFTIQASAPTVQSVTLSPTSVEGGSSSTGTVTLTSAAPSDTVVTLASDNTAAATVLASVTVTSGNSSATFTVSTAAVATSQTANITGSANSSSASAPLTITPPVLTNIAVVPASVVGGTSATATVTLDSAAPSAGIVVALSSDTTSAATVPGTTTVTSGNTTATATVSTSSVSTNTVVTVTASFNGTSKTATLTVTPQTAAGLSLNPTSVVGGVSSTGTITLSSTPTSDQSVALSSGNTAAATVPASVTVTSGTTSANFTVSTSPVSTNTDVVITATVNSTSQTATLTVQAPTVSALGLSPTSVLGGVSSTGTVTLSSAAPSGATVALSSNNGAATVPASATVSGTSGTFTVTTSGVQTDQSATITATFNSSSKTATLTVKAPTLTSVSVSPSSVLGGANSTGTVHLSSAAPSGGMLVSLSSNSSSATVPASVPVPVGSTAANFTVSTSAVASSTTATLTASLNGVTQTATLTVLPVSVSSLALSPTTVASGGSSTGTVTLNGNAPTAGVAVALSSSNTAVASVGASVTVASGSSSATFPVSAGSVVTTTTATITASANGTSKTATLTVNGLTIVNLALSLNPIVGTKTDSGAVYLSANAPSSGAVVSLTTSDAEAAGLPSSSITIPGGSSVGTFRINTFSVQTNTNVTIGASLGSSSKTVVLTVESPQITSFTMAPSPIVAGNPGQATLVLNAPIGVNADTGSSSIPVQFTSSPSGIVVFPRSKMSSGETYAYFSFTTNGVSSSTSVAVTVTVGSATKTTPITVLGADILSITPSSATLAGGSTEGVQLILNGKAGPSGTTVALSSSNNAALSVPASATVPAQTNTGSFTATSSGVDADTTVTLTATTGSTSKTTTIKVLAAHVASVALNQASIKGGTGTFGAVYLDAQAGPSGAMVALASSDHTVATTAPSVTVGAGLTGTTFGINTSAVTTTKTVTISASYGGVTKTVTLTVTP